MIPNLLALNERVVVSGMSFVSISHSVGEWKEGFYSLTAVGAYNVGSMSFVFDDVSSILYSFDVYIAYQNEFYP